jgi:hypothetical protein
LRDILRYDSSLKEHVERIYRERALASHLRSLKLFQYLDVPGLAKVIAENGVPTDARPGRLVRGRQPAPVG